MSDSSEVIGKESCPDCGSRDNLARYADGSAYCFTPDCERYERPTDSTFQPKASPSSSDDFIRGEVEALPNRRIDEDTCRKFDYRIGEYQGKKAHIATFWKDGKRVGQKIRLPGKDFRAVGKVSTELYGAHLWRDGGKKLVITEGEIDAMSVSQAQGNKWPVVSVPSGAGSVKKSLAANIEWLSSYDEIVLMFDQDDAGQVAVDQALTVLPPGKVKVATLPLKDASEMLKDGRRAELVQAIWDAKVRRPDGIVTVDDVIEQALKPVEVGVPWCLPTLTELTYGRHFGALYALGAGTGVGKTDFITQQVAHDIEHGRGFRLDAAPEKSMQE